MKDISQVREAIDNYKTKFSGLRNNKLLACSSVEIAERLGFEITDDMDEEDIKRIVQLKRIILEAINHNYVIDTICEQVEFMLFDED